VRLNEEVVLKTNNTQFTYSQISTITNNFDKMIGKGGCGIVYLGSLQDGTQVAVKMLLPKCPQGSQQFQTEACFSLQKFKMIYFEFKEMF